MRVIIINYAYPPGATSVDDLLQQYVNLTGWAESLRAAGCTVYVLQRWVADQVVARDGVTYEAIGDGWAPFPRGWHVPWRLHQRARDLCRDAGPTVVHFNGLLFPLQAWLLRRKLPADIPLLIQHHAEKPWPGYSGTLQRLLLHAASGFMFAAPGLADEWGTLVQHRPPFTVMETTSPFRLTDQVEARQQTGMHGEPVLFWAGRLNAIKDPLLVLSAVAELLPELPNLHLYMAYLDETLLPDIKGMLAIDAKLNKAVTLLGAIPHAEIQPYFNSADLFIQGSHREGSGVAVLDALACGVVPVITDIPAFRAITGEGVAGRLWPVGDKEACKKALREAAALNFKQTRNDMRHFFDERWSSAALGQQARSVYETLLNSAKR